MSRVSPRAFTLVELLVVIAIIGILVALVLPAVQASRETARRTDCQNHQRNVGLGFQLYHASRSRFPACRMEYFQDANGNKLNSPRVHNWVVFVLPYIEEAQLDRTYIKGLSWNHAQNRAAVKTLLPLLMCPSSPEGTSVFLNTSAGFEMAVSDYTTSKGIEETFYKQSTIPAEYKPQGNAAVACLGFPDLELELPASKIHDGLSKTLCLIEDAGRPSFYVTGGKLGPLSSSDKNPSYSNAGNLEVKNGVVTGGGWADPENCIETHTMSMDGLQAIGPCAMNCSNNHEPYSFHPGGMVVTLADGSVRFLAEDLEPWVFAMLTTRAGGETAPSGLP